MAPLIDLAVEADAWSLAAADLDAAVEGAVAAALLVAGEAGVEAPAGAELSLLLCDDSAIRALNRQWRGQDRPTNVLSFPAPPAMRAHALGDIAVAYETSAREAAERGVSLQDHLLHLVVHGVFHLLDYDHQDEDEAERMEALEARALARLGLASPFEAGLEATSTSRQPAERPTNP